jgi:flagellar motility protein MotE (MotC chaperone)
MTDQSPARRAIQWLRPPRLLPWALAAMAGLAVVKLERVLGGTAPQMAAALASVPSAAPSTPAAGPASSPPAGGPASRPPPPALATPLASPPPIQPAPEAQAERVLLENLRARRLELDRQAEELAQRELLLGAAGRRMAERVNELRALQSGLEGEVRLRDEREEARIRQLVRVYEAMRPRDAAAILDDLEMPILLQVIERMREAKASPVLAAMRPERARAATAELSRLRGRPTPQ